MDCLLEACVINEVDVQDLSAQFASWWIWCKFSFQIGKKTKKQNNEVALQVHRHAQVQQEQAVSEL